MSVNKVILVGRLGNDPELRYTEAKMPVANFNVATSESWVDKQNQKQQRTEWHKIVVWGRTAETCSQYLRKGREIYIEGKLQTREWQDQAGVKKYSTEVIAEAVQFIGSNDRNERNEVNDKKPVKPVVVPNRSQNHDPGFREDQW